MDIGARSARNELFQELKPVCVELSQLALRNDGGATSSKSLVQSTQKLLKLLEQKCQRTDGGFDDKLADYVFFPLSQILQRKKEYTDSLSEVTVKCLHILLEYGWARSISLDLARQLLILLTFVAGGMPGKTIVPVPEELMNDALGCLAALFQDLGRTPGGASCLIESSAVPALGHCVTVVLDGITGGPSANVQIQALQALDAVWHCVKDLQALSNFLPGTISALTKCLMPSTGSRRSKKTIINALEVLEHVLTTILSDIRTQTFKNEDPATGSEQKTLTKPWLKATTAQIKLALANIIRLRSHESADVRNALKKLCLKILDECHVTFSDSASMLVETCMTLSGAGEEDGHFGTTLTHLGAIYPDVGEIIKGTVYNWATSLPRVMQANDEKSKHIALGQLSNAHRLLRELNLDSSILDEALINSLRDSVTATFEASYPKHGVQEADFDLNSQAALTLVSDNAVSSKFCPIIMPEESRRETRSRLNWLLDNFGSREVQIKVASEMLEYAREGASGHGLLSAFWLSSQLLRSATSSNKELDELFDSALTLSDDQQVVNQELFSFSLIILSDADADSDWRLQAVALEVVADTAQYLEEGFRTELVDALYPIVQLLGASNPRLREHAITCLNIVSSACGYSSASELIIQNADYMVNAISLRLNTFDISPQAPQVLVMMIRLTGHSLLPYLDDVVGSIFAALDNFHGYHRLVEVLFSVLSEIVTVGSQSDRLMLQSSATISHLKTPPEIPTLESIITSITKRPQSDLESLDNEPTPHKPWKSAKTLLDEAEYPLEEPSDPPTEVAPPPPTKTHKMLQNIATLSQHHLTSASPILRSKLLRLITTASSSLQYDENTLLPLINELWPVVVKRLWDEEPFVVIAAADTIKQLCQAAGDFMGSRVKDEWNEIMKLAWSLKRKAHNEKGARSQYAQVSKVWEAIIGLLVTVVGYVRIDDDMFDQILAVLGIVVGRKDINEILERINADAVWLDLHLMNMEEGRPLEQPLVEGYAFAEPAV
ncbi:armadillo-type protein [Bisporella sp. PMI_857]|nr:armadillo-type protein [Bisporella sp. PMI_857]